MANYTTSATGTPGTYLDPRKKKKQNQALLNDPNAVPQTDGGPGGFVGPGGEAPGRQPFDIPEEYKTALERAAAGTTAERLKGIATTYGSKGRQMNEMLAGMGFGPDVQFGEAANQIFGLKSQQAAEESATRREEAADLANKEFGWLTSQMGQEQEMEKLRYGQAGAEKLKGMDIGLEEKKLAVTKDLAEKQLGFSYDQLKSTEGQNAAQRALTERLTQMGIGSTEAMAKAKNDLDLLIAGKQIDLSKYGIDVDKALKEAGLAQAGEQFTETMGLEKQKLTQQAEQFRQTYGYVDDQGNYVPGTELKSQQALLAAKNAFDRSLAEYQNGYVDANGKYVPGVGYEQAKLQAEDAARLAGQAEEMKYNLAQKASTKEAFENILTGVLTGNIGKDWQKDKAWGYVNDLATSLGVEVPDWFAKWAGQGGEGTQPTGGGTTPGGAEYADPDQAMQAGPPNHDYQGYELVNLDPNYQRGPNGVWQWSRKRPSPAGPSGGAF